jgi:hypothetical protein
MSVLIVLTNIVVRCLYSGMTRGLKRRSQAWASA